MKKITIDGTQYPFSDIDAHIAREFNKWAKPYLPDPLKVASETLQKYSDLPPDARAEIMRDAMQVARAGYSIVSQEVQNLFIDNDKAETVFACLLWRRHNPSLTQDQAEQLHEKAKELYTGAYAGKTQEQLDERLEKLSQ